MKFILAAILALQALTPRTPVLTVDLFSPAQTVTIKNLPATIDQACTVYASDDEKIQTRNDKNDLVDTDEQYKPRHCVALSGEDLDGKTWHAPSYTDDWNFIPHGHGYTVYAELYTTDMQDTDHPILTNSVKVFHP